MSYTINTTTSTADNNRFGYDATDNQVGQTFTTVGAGNLTQIDAMVFKVGTVTDNLILAIQALSGGFPDGVDLATATVTGSTLPTSASARTTFTFGSPASLAAATQYGIVYRRSGSLSTGNYYRSAGDGSGNPYAGGNSMYYDGAWHNLGTGNGDFNMEIFITTTSPNGNFLQFM